MPDTGVPASGPPPTPDAAPLGPHHQAAIPIPRRLAALGTRTLGVVGLVALAAGIAYTALPFDGQAPAGLALLASGVTLLCAAASLALVPQPHRDGPAGTGAGVRSLALFLQLIVVLGATALGLAMAQRAGWIHADAAPFVHGVPFAIVVVAATAGAAHVAGLSRTASPGRSPRATVAARLALGGTVVLVTAALLADAGRLGPVDAGAAGMMLLGAACVLAIATHLVHALPSVFDILVSADSVAHPGGRARSVVLPIVIAFTLVVLSLGVFLLFGVGVVGVIGQVSQSPSLILVLACVTVAMVAGLVATVRLVHREEVRSPVYRPYSDPRAARERRTLWMTVLGGVLLMGYGAATAADWTSFGTPAWIHFVAAGLLLALGPYGFMVAREAQRVRRLEDRFPDFLREIASSHKGGLTLADAVTVAGRVDYGPLSPEVRRMADQVAWNVPFTEALESFGQRVQTPLVQRAVNLILEADRSGGASTDVLLAAARDAREIKTLEAERRVSMSLYTVIVYITFFVFLGVASILYAEFVPHLVASANAAAASRTTTATAGLAGIGGRTLDVGQFQMFYFIAALVQGVGDGVVAGLMGTGRAVLGLRHAFAMVLATYVTFVVLLPT